MLKEDTKMEMIKIHTPVARPEITIEIKSNIQNVGKTLVLKLILKALYLAGFLDVQIKTDSGIDPIIEGTEESVLKKHLETVRKLNPQITIVENISNRISE